jgi:hypothetical protein
MPDRTVGTPGAIKVQLLHLDRPEALYWLHHQRYYLLCNASGSGFEEVNTVTAAGTLCESFFLFRVAYALAQVLFFPALEVQGTQKDLRKSLRLPVRRASARH